MKKSHPDLITEKSIIVLGIPFDRNSSFLTGPAAAPDQIRNGFFCPSANLWAENGTDLGASTKLFDVGDLNLSKDQDAFPMITESVKTHLKAGHHLISLGGDHSITYPIIKAHKDRYDHLNILHFDAHPDLYDTLDGNPSSHACPFARIMENNLADRLVQAGIRTMNGHQRAQAKRFSVEVHEMKDGPVPDLSCDGPVYLSIDIDCLDPAFAPGVSHHEPGGFSTRQLLSIIQNFKGRVIGADLVEYNPSRDLNNMTAMVCAKILKELTARIIQDNGLSD